MDSKSDEKNLSLKERAARNGLSELGYIINYNAGGICEEHDLYRCEPCMKKWRESTPSGFFVKMEGVGD